DSRVKYPVGEEIKMKAWRPFSCLAGLLAGICALRGTLALADEFDAAPIHYSSTQPANDLSKFCKKLTYTSPQGYLPSLLSQLNIPQSSQVLVFSKTSFQRERIAPATPRAIYFNDDTYVGYCQDGNVIEIAASDPNLGSVFYTLDQHERKTPILTRQTDNCLQ